MKIKAFFVTACLLPLSMLVCVHASASATGGYSVDICNPSEGYPGEVSDSNRKNFCSESAVRIYKKFTEKDINFAQKYVLIKMFKTSFVALDPKSKKVHVLPYKIEDSLDSSKAGKISFSRSGRMICSVGEQVSFSPYNMYEYTGGDSANPEYKLCIELSNSDGFYDFYPVHKKTGKAVSRL